MAVVAGRMERLMSFIRPGAAGITRNLFCSAAVAAVALPTTGFAQDNDSGAEQAQGNMIVVTATKRETTLQETPVAVSVTTGETIQREEIRDLKDLQSVVPSLRVTQLQSSANTNFIIRGFGNGANNAGIEPSVGVFIDGVYRSRTAASISDLPDISRIEVLRGPQSTLFGKNASAGVISLVTREPSFEPEGSVEVSYGNYNALVARGSFSGPISDSLAVSIAGGFNRRDGYNDDLGSGTQTNERDRWFVRGQMLFDNGDNFSIRLIGDYDKIDENCCGVVNVRSSLATFAIQALGGQINDPNDPFANVVYNNFPSTNEIENFGFSGQIDYDVGDFTLTSITSYRETHGMYRQDADFTSLDLFERFQDQNLETFTQEFRVTGALGPVNFLGGLFYFDESITEFQEVTKRPLFRNYADLVAGGDGTGSLVTEFELAIGALAGNPTQFLGQFGAPGTAEIGTFGLDNDALSLFAQFDIDITDSLVLTIGGNYTMDDKTGVTDYQALDVFSAIDLVDAGNGAIFAQGLADQVGGFLGLGRPATQQEIFAFATGTSPAGQAGAMAFPQIQAGVQAFADANDTNPNVNPFLIGTDLQLFPPFINIPNSVESGETSDNDFSYTIRLAYDVTPDVNIYASYATGFKASSFALSRDSRPMASNAGALQSAGLITPNLTFGSRFAGPEESEVIEFGLKGNWDRFSANLTGFRQDINGFQSNIFTGTGFILANAGKQRTYGVELESTANPTDPLTLNFAVTWLDPSYVSFPLSSVGDLSGTIPAGIPEWTIVLGAQWEQDLPNGDQVILRSTFHHESEAQVIEGLPGFLDPTLPDGGQAQAIGVAVPFTRQVDELSASITYVLDNPNIEFSVWGRNLLNDRYILSLFDSPGQSGSISTYPNQPRTYGATARFRF